MNLGDRIRARVRVDHRGCWVWQGQKKPDGYGRIRGVHGRLVYVHRAIYEDLRGAIPPGLHIDHLCRNPSCCNPDHLEAVTPKVNCQRSRAAETARRNRERQTRCCHGHLFTPDNSYFDARGYRSCKECRRIKNENWGVLRREKKQVYRTFAAKAPNVVSIGSRKNG